MRDLVFVKKDDATKKATLRVDMVENNFEELTIMWCSGVQGTEFEKIIPWKCGSVTSMTEVKKFCEQYQATYDCLLYGGSSVVTLGAPLHELTVTATITGADTAKATLKGTKTGAVSTTEEIQFTTAVAKKINGIEGYTYEWEVSGDVSWTSGSAPEAFVCTADADIALGLTVE